ncbi:hypothetical protein AB0937_35545 [Streptomyces sp. NPDC047880]
MVAVITVLALLQGLTAEESNKAMPLIVTALGVASLGMWTIGVRSKAGKK